MKTNRYKQERIGIEICPVCNRKITDEYHCTVYDTPPFYCSEGCWGEGHKTE